MSAACSSVVSAVFECLRAHEAAGQKLQGQRKKQPRCLELTQWRDESMSDLSPSTNTRPPTKPLDRTPTRRRPSSFFGFISPSLPASADDPVLPASTAVVCGLRHPRRRSPALFLMSNNTNNSTFKLPRITLQPPSLSWPGLDLWFERPVICIPKLRKVTHGRGRTGAAAVVFPVRPVLLLPPLRLSRASRADVDSPFCVSLCVSLCLVLLAADILDISPPRAALSCSALGFLPTPLREERLCCLSLPAPDHGSGLTDSTPSSGPQAITGPPMRYTTLPSSS